MLTVPESYFVQEQKLDEMVQPDGSLRPAWAEFMEHWNLLGTENVAAQFARGNQYLRDAGVFYRQYSEGVSTQRDWPLNNLPVMLEENEWVALGEGLVQRANLLESLLKDFYGPNRLVREGKVPAACLALNPEWLRPLVGLNPRGEEFLYYLAFDLGRDRSGRWLVLSDRVQAPSGIAFALENRVATTRVFAEIFQKMSIYRLAPFFGKFRKMLQGLNPVADGSVGILSPGPMNEGYFEHTYIARFLGLMLLEGEDLTVKDGQLLVKTVDGLLPLRVVWRRIDGAYADPLELKENSKLGTPGLIGAIRKQEVTLVNGLGSGVLENRIWSAFLPELCELLLEEELKLPNLKSFWSGDPEFKLRFREERDLWNFAPAFSSSLPFEMGGPTEHLSTEDCSLFSGTGGNLFVAQERASLSTTPVYRDGKLAAAPMTLRMFLVRTTDGWEVMPGGLARIGAIDREDSISLQKGGTVADVWVKSKKPTENYILNPSSGAVADQLRHSEYLPSRTADNLYWLGRYVERMEGLLRLLRAYHTRCAELGTAENPLLDLSESLLRKFGIWQPEFFQPYLNLAVGNAIQSASKVKDRFSYDGWMALRDLEEKIQSAIPQNPTGDAAASLFGSLLRQCSAFSGLVHENMYRFKGWRFLCLGRSIERILLDLQNLEVLLGENSPTGATELAIELGDSQMILHRRYWGIADFSNVVDLLVMDSRNPRSIRFNLLEIKELLAKLPDVHNSNSKVEMELTLEHFLSLMNFRQRNDFNDFPFPKLSETLRSFSDQLSTAYFN